ncbi:MAG: hypothetical protein NWQ13_08110, partial [Glaciimonas sp.]|nr:hypothetical protein [Glaciimonas sp.]
MQVSCATEVNTPNTSNYISNNTALSTLAQDLKTNPAAGALVTALQKSEQSANVNTAADATATTATPPPASKGLIGLISNSLDSAQSHIGQVTAPQKYWSQQFSHAWMDFSTLLSRQADEPPLSVLINFGVMLLLFSIVLLIFQYLGKRVRAHFQMHVELSNDPSIKELSIFIFHRIVPWLLALLVVISVVLSLPPSLGRTLATLLLYTLVGARLFRAICALIFSLSHTGHRTFAIHIIYRHGWKLLYAIGCAGFLGDAINNPKLFPIIGTALSSMVSTLANLTAVILCCVFALRFQ